MSKKLSKVLVVAVVLVLAMSAVALVACGGPEPLEGKTAMATLQKNFNSAKTKTVTENVKLGGLEVKAGPDADKPMLHLVINNVDVKLVRAYASDGSLTLTADVSNLDLEVKKGLNLLSVVKSMIGNLDETVIKNFSKVGLHAKLVVNPTLEVSEYDDYMQLLEFEITNLDKVVDAKGDQWTILKDGGDENGENKQFLGASYIPKEILKPNPKDNKINPRQMKDGKPVGIFAQMDEYATAKTSDGKKLGAYLENFILENYEMISAYNFTDVKVDKSSFSSNAPADFNKLYTVGTEALNAYKGNAIKDKNDKDIIKIGALVDKVFGRDAKIKSIANSLVNLDKAAVEMNGTMKDVDGTWQIATLNTKQTLNVTVTKALLEKVIDDVLPIFNVNLAKIEISEGTFINLSKTAKDLVANGIITNVTASVNATFEY